MVRELDENDFRETVQGEDIVFVDFWAPWCGPCRAFAPIYEKVAQRHPDVVFAKVNTEQAQALAAHFNIRSVPTLMVFREGVILFAQPGALPEQALEALVEQVKAVDMAQVHAELARREAEG